MKNYYGIEQTDFEQMTPEFIKAFPNMTKLIVTSKLFIVSRATMHAILDSQIQDLELAILIHENDEDEIDEIVERIRAKMRTKIEIEIVN